MTNRMPLPPGLRNLRHAAASGVLSLLALGGSAAAAELPGAHLDVVRGAGASGCPDSEQLSAEVARRFSPGPTTPSEALLFTVALDGDGETYVADVRVEGRRHGERTLRAAGPTCDALQEALIVTLLVLLDEDRAPAAGTPGSEPSLEGAPANAGAAVVQPPTAAAKLETVNGAVAPPASQPIEAIAPPRRPSPPLSLWLSLGGAVTRGVPLGWSGGVLFDLSVRYGAFEVSAGGFWGPSRTVAVPPGSVEVSVFGERLRGCYALRPIDGSELRVLGCATGALAQLTGRGVNLVGGHAVTQAWGLLGGAAEATLPLTARIEAGLGVAALATLAHEAFSVDDSGSSETYGTEKVVLLVAVRLEARLF